MATTSREIILPWVDLALKLQGHPPCERIVNKGRNRRPKAASWELLAREISEKSGGNVTSEFLRLTFGRPDGGAE